MHSSGTVNFNFESHKVIDGTLTGASAFNDVTFTSGSVTAFDGDGVVQSDPTSSSDRFGSIAIDNNYIYLGGYQNTGCPVGSTCWRVEKRDKVDGSLVTAFDGDGVLLSDPTSSADQLEAIAVDTEYIYTAGSQSTGGGCSTGDDCWRVEKRDKVDGSLVAAFDGDGVVQSDPTASGDYISSITVDANYIYLGGYQDGGCASGGNCWRVEKRNKVDGSLVTTFDGDGVVQSDPTSSSDQIITMTNDLDYIYIAGNQSTGGNCSMGGTCWRAEKRDKFDGSLVTAFDGDGFVQSDPTSSSEHLASITVDNNYIYLGGRQDTGGDCSSGGFCWRIEKRNKFDGSFVTAFDGDGVLNIDPTSSNDRVSSIIVDANYIYIGGDQATGGDCSTGGQCWRIEKRDKVDGSLVESFNGDGIAQSDLSVTNEFIGALTIDTNYIYIGGRQDTGGGCSTGSLCGRLEKRDIGTGDLVNGVNSMTLSGTLAAADITIVSGTLNVDGYALDMSGTMSISGTLDTTGTLNGESLINIAGNWNMDVAGTFVSGNSTVIFDGASQSIDGSTWFNNFTKTDPTNDDTDVTLTFEAGTTQVITGSLMLDGIDTLDRVNLLSATPSSRFNLNVTNAGETTTWLDISDSEILGNDVVASNSLNTSNNDFGEGSPQWLFGFLINISGITNLADATGVAVAVDNVLSSVTTTVTGGAWTLTNVVVDTDDIITVWGSSIAESLETTGITEYDGSGNITGMILNSGTLSLGSDDNYIAIEITELGQYDNNDDEDIVYVLSGGNTLQSVHSEMSFLINTGSFVTDGYELDINGEMEIVGTLDASSGTDGNTLINVGGSWDMSSGVFTNTNSTIIFDNTLGNSLTITSNTKPFFNVTIDDSIGSSTSTWTLQDAFDVDGTLTIGSGIFVQGSGNNMTVASTFIIGPEGTFTKDAGAGIFTFDGSSSSGWRDDSTYGINDLGNVTIDKSGGTPAVDNIVNLRTSVKAETVTIGANDTLHLGNEGHTFALTGSGAPLTINGDLDVGSWSNVEYTSGSGATVNAITFDDLTINGVGAFTSAGSLTVNDMRINSGTFVAPTTELTVTGNWLNDDVFTHSSGTLNFNFESNKIIEGTLTGASAFNNVTFTSGSVTAFDGDGILNSDPTGSTDLPNASVSDENYIYVGGYQTNGAGCVTGGPCWRIEKRNKSDGSLVTAFDGDGVVQSDPTNSSDLIYAMSVDDNYLYVGGAQLGGADCALGGTCWRIEKRNKTDGSLVTTFGGDGAVHSDPTSSSDQISTIAIDLNYVYIGGYQSNGGGCATGSNCWRLEKRDKIDGSLVTDFDGDGVILSDPTTGGDIIASILEDLQYLYVGGYQGNGCSMGSSCWRIEKRNKSDGSLVTAFDGDGIAQSDFASSLDILTSMSMDEDYLYIGGEQNGGADCGTGAMCWRFEKRNKTDGSLVTTFGGDGAVHIDPTSGSDRSPVVVVDANYLYATGYENGGGDCTTGGHCWRTEKRNKSDGSLVELFGGDGAIHSDPSAASDQGKSIIVDTNYLYVTGNQGSSAGCGMGGFCWRIEKRDVATGELVNGVNSMTLTGTLDAANLTIISGTLSDDAYEMDLSGTMSISGTLEATGTFDINVAGNWDMNATGTFDSGNSTVILDGTNQDITGSTWFNNFTKIDSADDDTDVSLTFEAGSTQTISGSLTLDGIDTLDRVNLLSDTPSTRFNLNVTNANETTTWLDVSDSEVLSNDLATFNSLDTFNTDSSEGSPRWLFGSIINISGIANLIDTTGVALAVNSSLSAVTTTVSGGAWTLTSVAVFANDIVTVWADSVVDSLETTGITEYDGSGNVTGMILNSGTLSFGSDDDSISITMTELGQYDNNEDEDVLYVLSAGNTLESVQSRMELLINTGTLITDGYEMDINGTIGISGTLDASSGAGGNTTIDVGGGWYMSTGTFINTASTVLFSGTSVPGTFDISSGSNSFNTIQFDNSAAVSEWLLLDGLTVDGSLLMDEGILDTDSTSSYSVSVGMDVISTGGTIRPNDSAWSVGRDFVITGTWVPDGEVLTLAGSGNVANNQFINRINHVIQSNGVTTTLTDTVWLSKLTTGDATSTIQDDNLGTIRSFWFAFNQGTDSTETFVNNGSVFNSQDSLALRFSVPMDFPGGDYGSTDLYAHYTTGSPGLVLQGHITDIGDLNVYNVGSVDTPAFDANGFNITAESLTIGSEAFNQAVGEFFAGEGTITIEGSALVEDADTGNGFYNTLNAESASIFVAGNLLNEGTLNAGTSTFTMNGNSGTSTITPNNFPLYNLIIDDGNGGGDLTVEMVGTLQAGGTLTITDGSLDLDGYEAFVDGNVIVTDTLDAGPGTDGDVSMRVGGNWDMTSGTFTSTDSSVMFVGTTSGLTITSDTKPFNDIVINGTVGLVGYWKLDDTTSPAVDYSGYGNNGTWVDNTTFDTDTTGTINFNNPASATFDGAGDYIEIQSTPDLDVQNFTFSAWFRSGPAASWTSFPSIFMRGDNSGDNELFIGFTTTLDDSITVALDGNFITFAGGVDKLDQQWHHIGVTYNTVTLTVYIDGAQFGAPLARTDTLDFGGSNAWIGTDVDAFNSSFSNYWDGEIDDVRLYNRALSITEVQTLANGNMPGTGLGTYTLQDGLDVDGTLSLNDGTLDTGTNQSINVGGSWLNHGGKFVANSGQVVLDGTATDNLILSGTGTFNAVDQTGSGTWTLQDNVPMTGTFDVSAGTLTYATSTIIEPINIDGGTSITGGTFTGNTLRFRHDGDLSIASGTYTAPTNVVEIDGHFDHSGGTFTNSSSTVMFTGTETNLTIDTAGGTTFHDVIVNDGLVGYWKLDETASPAIDSSGYGNDGIWMDHVSGTLGVSGTINFANGGSADFDGNTDYILTNKPHSHQFTISMWVNYDNTSSNVNDGLGQAQASGTTPSIVSLDKSIGMFVERASSTVWGRLIQSSGVVVNLPINPGAVLSAGTWQHLVYRADGTNYEVFLNGDTTPVATVAYDGTVQDHDSFFIGRQAGESLKGQLDEFRIYNRALTSTEIARITAGNMPQSALGTYELQTVLDIDGTLRLNSGTLDVSSNNYQINVGGSWLNHGGVFAANSGQVVLDGTAIDNLILSGSGIFNSIDQTGSGTWKLQDNVPMTGTFDVSAGTLTYATSTIIEPINIDGGTSITGGTFTGNTLRFRHDGDLSIASGTYTAPTDVVEIDGSFNHSGGTFTNSSSTVMFTGTETNLTIDTTGGATFQDVIVNDGLVGYWKLDESTSPAVDSSGYGNDGTWISEVSGSMDISGTINFANEGSAYFEGLADAIVVADKEIHEPSQFTVSLWAKFDFFQDGWLVSKQTSMPTVYTNGYLIRSDSPGNTVLCYVGNGSTFANLVSPVMTPGQWYHIACTYDEVNVELYLNGVSAGTAALASGVGYAGVGDLYIGGESTLGGLTHDGHLDDVRIYNRPLSTSEIQLLATGNQPSTAVGTYELQTALDVDGTLRLNSGELDVSTSNYQINVGGDWENFGGTFDAQAGSVILDGSDQQIPASETFYTLQKVLAAGPMNTITFGQQSTITMKGIMRLEGFDGSNLLYLQSSSSGTQWKIDPQGSRIANFLNVQDSENLTMPEIGPTNSIDGGNNILWFRPVVLRGSIMVVD